MKLEQREHEKGFDVYAGDRRLGCVINCHDADGNVTAYMVTSLDFEAPSWLTDPVLNGDMDTALGAMYGIAMAAAEEGLL